MVNLQQLLAQLQGNPWNRQPMQSPFMGYAQQQLQPVQQRFMAQPPMNNFGPMNPGQAQFPNQPQFPPAMTQPSPNQGQFNLGMSQPMPGQGQFPMQRAQPSIQFGGQQFGGMQGFRPMPFSGNPYMTMRR